jgi:GDP-mannose pyrophosphatase NudK
VLLTRQLRLPVFLQNGTERTVEACAGKLDGEQAEQRIVKEMQEELWLQDRESAAIVRALCKSSRDHGKDLVFTCAYSPADKVSDGGGLKEEGEDIDVVETTFIDVVETTLEGAVAMIATGEIVDTKTVVLIQYLSQRVRASDCA